MKIVIGEAAAIGPMKVKLARLASAANIAAILVSAVFYLIGWDVVGLGLLIVALIAFCFLIGTGVYRIAGGQPADDIEKMHMQEAYASSYWVIGIGLIFAVLFLQLFDGTASLLQNEDVHSFLFWSITSFIMVLPAAFLAWKMPVEEISEEDS